MLIYHLEIIVGHKIKDVQLDDEKTILTFYLYGDRKVVFNCEGECCNKCWIENVDGIENLIDQVIFKFEVKSLDNIDEDEDCDDVDVLSYELYTEKGVCLLEFRNGTGIDGYSYSGDLNYDYEESDLVKKVNFPTKGDLESLVNRWCVEWESKFENEYSDKFLESKKDLIEAINWFYEKEGGPYWRYIYEKFN